MIYLSNNIAYVSRIKVSYTCSAISTHSRTFNVCYIYGKTGKLGEKLLRTATCMCLSRRNTFHCVTVSLWSFGNVPSFLLSLYIVRVCFWCFDASPLKCFITDKFYRIRQFYKTHSPILKHLTFKTFELIITINQNCTVFCILIETFSRSISSIKSK